MTFTMLASTLAAVAETVGGVLEGADPSMPVRAVVTDSRAAGAGAVFIALRGERTDGQRFVGDALAAGAAAAIVRADAAVEGPVIRVADPLLALRDLAAAARARLDATVIAVTGSSGKTGTKDLIAAACSGVRRTVASEASYNNEIGVPLTVLAADERTEVLVVEIGSRGPGHIRSLLPVVGHHIAVLTNVGSAHLGMFGSIEATAAAKAELLEEFAHGTAVLNADDPAVRAMAEGTDARVVLAGRAADAHVRATEITMDEAACGTFTVEARGERARVRLRLPGEHAVANAVLAIAAALEAGIGIQDAARGVETCEPAPWRMEVRRAPRGTTIINDAYNANPDSTAAALKTLATMGKGKPTWAVLGVMAELGEHHVAEHDRIGRLAVRVGIGHLITVGDDARAIHEAARLEGMFGGEAVFAPVIDDALAILREQLTPDAVVLVKASRAAGLERIAHALEELT